MVYKYMDKKGIPYNKCWKVSFVCVVCVRVCVRVLYVGQCLPPLGNCCNQ